MQSSKELQEDIRKPSSVINAKKEENNRMGKKIRDTKGTFHAKMGLIRRNGMDLTEAEDFKKRLWAVPHQAPLSMGFSRQEY